MLPDTLTNVRATSAATDSALECESLLSPSRAACARDLGHGIGDERQRAFLETLPRRNDIVDFSSTLSWYAPKTASRESIRGSAARPIAPLPLGYGFTAAKFLPICSQLITFQIAVRYSGRRF